MNILQNRIDSFNNNSVKWPHNNDNFPKIESFAKAGFYFVRKPKAPDTVCCFLCDIKISHWRPGQSPLVRHGIESPQCAWKLLNFPDVPSSVSRKIKSVCLPRSIEMCDARLATFNHLRYWPPKKDSSNYPNCTKLANAGFFFTPTTTQPSRIKCAHCDLTLTVNSNDQDLMNIHRDISKDCLFFQKVHNTRTGNSVNKPASINDNNNSQNDTVGSKRRIRKISSFDHSDVAYNNKRQKENPSVRNNVITSVGTSYGAKKKIHCQTIPVNSLLHRPMITYGKSRYGNRLLSKRNNAGTPNILPDLNTLVRYQPNKTSTLGQEEASGSGAADEDNRKIIQPVTRRVLEGRVKKPLRKAMVADTESSMTKKRNLPKTFTSDTANPSKRLRLQVVVDNMKKEKFPTPVRKDKGKGKAVTFDLTPQTIPLPQTYDNPPAIPFYEKTRTSTPSQASCSYTPAPFLRTTRGFSSSSEEQEDDNTYTPFSPTMDFSISS